MIVIIALFVAILFIAVGLSFVIAVVAAIGRVLSFLFGSRPVQPLPAVMPDPTQRCRRAICRATNPAHARFCRQCGMAMAANRVDVRRVAAMI